MTLELDDNVFRTTLERAARRNRLDINTSEMLTVLRCDSTLILAPLREFDATPATALRNGVDSLFAYIDSAAKGIPAGFYTLRVSSDEVKLGEVSGTLEYLDSRGQVTGRSSIRLDIKSLTVPEPPPFPHAVVSVSGVEPAEQTNSGTTRTDDGDLVIVCCPNGYCWFEKKKASASE
ncbi:MAG TPA: hypothetical protein VKU77_06455 [Streptosporangiaceae bacterium]|jgi:hypothetical protein|nr:hypothetical protein [Streptosporangiaceae bacterium]